MTEKPPPSSNSPARTPLRYSDSGVDLKRAGEAKEAIRALARSTFSSDVVGDIGSFGGLFRIPFGRYINPLLVSSVDGIGTKLKIAFMTGIHDSVGADLVAHCCNDILVQGALPLFFLDYIACGRLEPPVIESLVSGRARACRESGCALLGGETAEMPDFYAAGEYDLAGFIVGVVEEERLLDGSAIEAGDLLLGLPSSGLHTNGYSLARKIFFERENFSCESRPAGLSRSVGEELLEPHRNYLPILRELVSTDDLHGLAHITGGGIPGNLSRILPSHLDAVVERGSWEILPVFRFLRQRGRVPDQEMLHTFNMGLGMILVAARGRADRVQEYLQQRGHSYFLVGEIAPGEGRVRFRQPG